MNFSHADITERIIGCAMKVHRVLGPGFLESIYQGALEYEFKKAAMAVCCEERIRVVYDGIVLGEFVVDMLVEGCILIENKAVRALNPAHESQLVHYLTAPGLDVGLLLNFGAADISSSSRVLAENSGRSRPRRIAL